MKKVVTWSDVAENLLTCFKAVYTILVVSGIVCTSVLIKVAIESDLKWFAMPILFGILFFFIVFVFMLITGRLDE